MSNKRTYAYNIVLQENNICPEGELLTDKELEKIRRHNWKRDWPNTAPVKVSANSIYFCFGVRFTDLQENYIEHHIPEKIRQKFNKNIC